MFWTAPTCTSPWFRRAAGGRAPWATALVAATAAALVLAGSLALQAPAAGAQTDPRFFSETGFTIANDAFWNYFQRRGGLRTFGYPTSREFSLEGFRVQFFQRQVMQLHPDGQVRLLNLLDPAVLPYTRMNGSTFPAADPALLNGAPSPADPQYGERIVQFVREVAPDTFAGKPVNFGNTVLSLVRYEDAFPFSEGPASLMPLINILEIAGLPTSAPAVDPKNDNFIYQRFQRLVLQHDSVSNTTQALLLADALKGIITGQNLPPDLEEQARDSKFFKQYDRRRSGHLARPSALPNTDLTNAFEREDKPLAAVDLEPRVTIETRPASVPVGSTFTVTVSGLDDAGIGKLFWRAEGSGVPELDQLKEVDCSGTTACVRSWNAVSRVAGGLTLVAYARDTADQQSEVARTTVSIVNTLQGALEMPAAGSKVGGRVKITGWAADKASPAGTGVQAIHVYLDGEQGQGFFLGAAEYGLERPDIATNTMGDARFTRVGFSLEWDSTKVAAGEHTIYAYALSAVTGRWQKFTSKVTVVAKPFADDPVIRVVEPNSDDQVDGSGQLIRGWAVDRNATTGTGVDRVEVWLDGERNTPGAVRLGDVVYGSATSDPSAVIEEDRFRQSGFSLTWSPNRFRPGDHVLYVYAHSTVTDTWSLVKVPVRIR